MEIKNEYQTFLQSLDEINFNSNQINQLLDEIIHNNFLKLISEGLSSSLRLNFEVLNEILRNHNFGYYSNDRIIPYDINVSIEPYLYSISMSGSYPDHNFHVSYSNNSRYIYIDVVTRNRISPVYHNDVLFAVYKNNELVLIPDDILIESGYGDLPKISSEWSEELYMMLKLTV